MDRRRLREVQPGVEARSARSHGGDEEPILRAPRIHSGSIRRERESAHWPADRERNLERPAAVARDEETRLTARADVHAVGESPGSIAPMKTPTSVTASNGTGLSVQLATVDRDEERRRALGAVTRASRRRRSRCGSLLATSIVVTTTVGSSPAPSWAQCAPSSVLCEYAAVERGARPRRSPKVCGAQCEDGVRGVLVARYGDRRPSRAPAARCSRAEVD